MNIILKLPAKLATQLQEDADRRGLSLNRYLLERLRGKGTYEPIPLTEEDLREQVAPTKAERTDWERFHALVAQQKAGKSDKRAEKRLATLTKKIEAANANRLPYLMELAHLRNTTLNRLMEDLDMRPPLFLYD